MYVQAKASELEPLTTWFQVLRQLLSQQLDTPLAQLKLKHVLKLLPSGDTLSDTSCSRLQEIVEDSSSQSTRFSSGSMAPARPKRRGTKCGAAFLADLAAAQSALDAASSAAPGAAPSLDDAAAAARKGSDPSRKEKPKRRGREETVADIRLIMPLLVRVLEGRNFVVVVDDVHRLDVEAWELLLLLLQRRLKLCLILSGRSHSLRRDEYDPNPLPVEVLHLMNAGSDAGSLGRGTISAATGNSFKRAAEQRRSTRASVSYAVADAPRAAQQCRRNFGARGSWDSEAAGRQGSSVETPATPMVSMDWSEPGQGSPTSGGASFSWGRAESTAVGSKIALHPTVVLYHIDLSNISEHQIRHIIASKCANTELKPGRDQIAWPEAVVQALGERNGRCI